MEDDCIGGGRWDLGRNKGLEDNEAEMGRLSK